MPGRPKMITYHGHEAGLIVSWLQKAIRRGNAQDAVYCAVELDRSGWGEWCWKRLLIIASEDVGIADPTISSEIWSLYQTYLYQKKKDAEPRLMLVHAVLRLAYAKKDSEVVNAVVWARDGVDHSPKPEIPDYVYDRHTLKGKQMGRGYEHFVEEGSLLENRIATPIEGTMKGFFLGWWRRIFLSRDGKDDLGPVQNGPSPDFNGPEAKNLTTQQLFGQSDEEAGNDRFTN